jgi:hypothetical protein
LSGSSEVADLTERTAVMLVWDRERDRLTPKHQQHVTHLEKQFLEPLLAFYRRGIDDGYFRRMDRIEID